MDEKITSVIPIECPHCKEQVIIALETPTPSIKTITTTTSLAESKEKLKESIKSIGLSEVKLFEILEWLSQDDTIILPTDVEKILDEIKEQNGITKEVKTK